MDQADKGGALGRGLPTREMGDRLNRGSEWNRRERCVGVSRKVK